MLKINKKVEYALIVLKFMSDKNNRSILVSAREVCDAFDIPFDTTAKVMQIMNNHDILSSVKGIKGGYTLKKSLNEVTYMQLVQMIEGLKTIGKVCSSHKGDCELLGKCNISTPVENLNRKLNSFLHNLTLQELLMGTEFNRPMPTTLKTNSLTEVNV